MKILAILTLLTLTAFVQAEEKVYLDSRNLSFNEQGIFLKSKECFFELPFVCFDYATRSFYLNDNQKAGVTIVKCGACRLNTWWVEKNCCLNGNDCPYYCY